MERKEVAVALHSSLESTSCLSTHGLHSALVSEATVKKYNIPFYSLAQSLRQLFTGGRQTTRIGNITAIM